MVETDEVNRIMPVKKREVSNSGFENNIRDSFVTKEMLEYALNNYAEKITDKISNQINPRSALSPEVQGVVKAINQVAELKDVIEDPVSKGIKDTMSSITNSLLGNAVNNMINPPQGSGEKLLDKVVLTFTRNVSARFPETLDILGRLLGEERLRRGADIGMNYMQGMQNKNSLPTIVSNLDPNNNEHVAYYAQEMGFSTLDIARQSLIDHQSRLYLEQKESNMMITNGNNIIREDTTREDNRYIGQSGQTIYSEEVEPTIESVEKEEIVEETNNRTKKESKTKMLKVSDNDIGIMPIVGDNIDADDITYDVDKE